MHGHESSLSSFVILSGGYALFVFVLAVGAGKSGWRVGDLLFALIVGGGIALSMGRSTMGNEGGWLTVAIAIVAGIMGERRGRQERRVEAELAEARMREMLAKQEIGRLATHGE